MSEASETISGQRSAWARLAPFVAPACVLLALVVPFLRFHEYSLFRPESLLLAAGAVALGVAVGALGRLRPDTVSPLLMTLTICAFVFLQDEVNTAVIKASIWTADFVASTETILGVFCVAAFLALAPVCVLLKRHLDTIVAAVFGTIAVTAIMLPVETSGEPVETGALPKGLKDLPAVVHIILDEHIGTAGIPSGFPESEPARRAIASTFRDFRLYTHVHSRFAETKFTLTSMMNGDVGVAVTEILDGDGSVFTPQRNAWFDQLEAEGYAIKVYQSTWYDMCGGTDAVDACYTYSFFSPNVIQRSTLSTGQRLRALLTNLLFGAQALQLEPLVSLEALRRFRMDIAATPRGVAYIVHLIIPHYGYLFDSDCRLLDPSEWKRAEYGDDLIYTKEERNGLYRRYLRQLLCTGRQVDELFVHLKQAGAYDDATIIVHGDHGSRLARHPYITETPETLSPQDMKDLYSTLLAVKAPGIAPEQRDEPRALEQAFAESFLAGATPQSPDSGTVFMRTGEGGEFAPLRFVWPDRPVDGPDRVLGELRR